MNEVEQARCAAAALFAALGMKAAGAAISTDSLTRAVQALGISVPDAWILEAIRRLANQDQNAAAEPAGEGAARPAAQASGSPERAFYLYALGQGEGCDGLACRGVDDRPVRVVKTDGWFALVHECPPQPYASEDRQQVIRWVEQHNSVLEQAAEAAGDIIPVAFDTIVHRDGMDAATALKEWISASAGQLQEILRLVCGCREYGVQLIREPLAARRYLLDGRADLKRLQERIQEAPGGVAYLLQEELEREIRQALHDHAAQRVAELEKVLHEHCRRVRADKLREPGDGREMLANLSCLVPNRAVERLLESLRALETSDGYEVRVTGPWPPYSFANLDSVGVGDEAGCEKTDQGS